MVIQIIVWNGLNMPSGPPNPINERLRAGRQNAGRIEQ
jgi:hypothetical protein